MITDFEKFAMSQGISTNKIDGYAKYNLKNGIIEPYILEERKLNVSQLDVFSRLMYDRIIYFTGVVKLRTNVCVFSFNVR